MASKFTVDATSIPGYVQVLRGKEVICAGREIREKILTDIEFLEDRFRKSNKTRIAAMDALKKAGYR